MLGRGPNGPGPPWTSEIASMLSVLHRGELWQELREGAEEIEEDTPEAFLKRQQLIRLLVERTVVGRDHNGDTPVEITYRFCPPDDTTDGADRIVGNVRNSSPNLRSR